MSEKEFVEKIGLLAAEDMKRSGILASVTTAQAILESGYGTTDLARHANNLFGMKCYLSGNTWSGSTWDGESEYWKYTEEQNPLGEVFKVYANFRAYSSWGESIGDHSAYLLGAKCGAARRYPGLSGEKRYRVAAQIIKDGGYATDVNYVSKLCNIIERWGLTRFDGVEVGEDVGIGDKMKIFVCVGHAVYKNGAISSADGVPYGGVNEYKYNKELAPYVVKWLRAAGHEVDLCIAPEKTMTCLSDEIAYFIGLENAGEYDLAIQLHLNASESRQGQGCEAYAYNNVGLKFADNICKKLGTVWKNRGPQIRKELYWTRKTEAKAVLIESFFCDNVEDWKKAQKLGFDAHGKLIAEGICGKDIVGDVNEGAGESGASATDDIKYYVQIGAYSKKENAEKQAKAARKAGFDVCIKEG